MMLIALWALSTAPSLAATPEEAATVAASLMKTQPPEVGVQLQANPWVDLLHKIGEHGMYAEGVPYIELKTRVATPKNGRIDEAAALWGAVSQADRKFHPSFVSIVHGDWTPLKGHRDRLYLDQWLFKLHLDGTLMQYRRTFVVEDKGGRVYSSGDLSATETEAKRKLASSLNYWYRYKP